MNEEYHGAFLIASLRFHYFAHHEHAHTLPPKSFIARVIDVIGREMTNLLIFKRGKAGLSRDNF
jgi:hypothetical protein